MLYTASYLEPKNHHGSLICISRSIPKGFKVAKNLPFLIPDANLLNDWKAKTIDEEIYTQRYREQIKQSWKKVKTWLDSLEAKEHQTLLCWEKSGSFCHRKLVGKLIQHYRPDTWGGGDIGRVEMEKCGHCDGVMIPGLDASQCVVCKLWVSQ